MLHFFCLKFILKRSTLLTKVGFSINFGPSCDGHHGVFTFMLILVRICWLMMIPKWHEYIAHMVFICTPQSFRFNNSTQSKASLFIDIKVMMWLSAASIKASSLMWTSIPCMALVLNTFVIPLTIFWCCGRFVHRALNL